MAATRFPLLFFGLKQRRSRKTAARLAKGPFSRQLGAFVYVLVLILACLQWLVLVAVPFIASAWAKTTPFQFLS